MFSCQDPEQKANMVKRFKSFFVKEREEKAREEKERAGGLSLSR